jgi:DNA-binding IclR family transcriptional regulator
MAYVTIESNDLQHLAHPSMKQLSELHHENVNLSILEDTDVVYVDVIESSQRVKLAAVIGQKFPAFCIASGKAILVFLPDDKIRQVLNRGLRQYTEHTITTLEENFETIIQARKTGFSISEQELEEGINDIAACMVQIFYP